MFRIEKNFYVYDLKQQRVIWDIPKAERVFFVGKNSTRMQELTFVDKEEVTR